LNDAPKPRKKPTVHMKDRDRAWQWKPKPRGRPNEYDLKSVKFRRGPPPVHASWRALNKTDKTFRQELRDKDYEHYQRIMGRFK